mgnify:CR=1 FL=1
METRYASAERTPDNLIYELFSLVNSVPFVQELLDKTTEIMFVLNKDRQVVFTNKAFMDFIGITDIKKVLGKRPGEALTCEHAEKVSGCGTTEFCITCGAVNAILASQKNDSEVHEECLLSLKGGGSFELSVITRPFDYKNEKFTFFTAKDISESKRKNVLERIFFHDIMNLASGIYSVIDLFKDGTIDDLPEEMLQMLHSNSSEMVKEIESYRTLMQAERKELNVHPESVGTEKLISTVVALYEKTCERSGIILKVMNNSAQKELYTDPSLLKRILINMIKNAIEASGKGDQVSVWCEGTGDGVVFKVNNPRVMDDNVRTQVFRRTFTTKPSGSGLGSYSMKLLGESYLKGKVSFKSKKEEGTTFEVFLPYSIS